MLKPPRVQWGDYRWWLCRYLLPPVIFYCGLSVEKSRFFLALPSILMYGVFGTLASFLIISVFMYLTLGFAMFKMEVSRSSVFCCHGLSTSVRGSMEETVWPAAAGGR